MKYVLTNKEIKSNYGEEILIARGVKFVKEFVSPTPAQLQSASELENIYKAAKVVYDITKTNGKIALIVD